jgi:hypothetical protein
VAGGFLARVPGRRAEPLPAPSRGAAALPAPQRPAEVHLHFHGVSAEDAAAIVRRAIEDGSA